MSVIVTAAELAASLAGPTPPRLLDVRWTLAAPDGREAYAAEHLPGAVYVDLETELSDHYVTGAGRHPLPSKEALQAAARSWGLESDDAVVVYDDWHGLAAARAWWLLRHAGVRQVSILSGGIGAWRAAGLETQSGVVTPPPGGIVLEWGYMPIISADQAGEWSAHGVLLDARAGERYRGEVEPIDPRAGHIPGALSAPTTDNLDSSGRFRSPAQLEQRFAELGITADTPLAVYCGSGVTAAHQIAALEHAGLSAALFPGSWSQWSNENERLVAVGE